MVGAVLHPASVNLDLLCLRAKKHREREVPDVLSLGRLIISNQSSELDRSNVLGSRAFWATASVEGNLLSFSKCFKINSFYSRAVEEHVGSGAIFDETKSFVSNSLNRSFSHCRVPMLSKILCRQRCVKHSRSVDHTWIMGVADVEPLGDVFDTSLPGVLRRVRQVLPESAEDARLLNSLSPVQFRLLSLPSVSGGEHAYPRPWSSFPSLADAWRMYSDSLRWDFSLNFDGAQ